MEYYLIHHGVQGMKWGVMHGPPYPLTGENKKAFNADKKSFFNAEKEHRKTLSKYDREAYDRQAKGSAISQYTKHWEAGRAAKKAGNKAEAKKEFYKGTQYRDYAMRYDSRNNPGKAILKSAFGGGAVGGAVTGLALYDLGKEYDDPKYVNKELQKMIDEMTLNKFAR